MAPKTFVTKQFAIISAILLIVAVPFYSLTGVGTVQAHFPGDGHDHSEYENVDWGGGVGGTDEDIYRIRLEIENKQREINEYNQESQALEEEIDRLASEANTLKNKIAQLQAKIDLSEADKKATENEIASLELEIQKIQLEEVKTEEDITHTKRIVGEVLRNLYESATSKSDTLLQLVAGDLSKKITEESNLKQVSSGLERLNRSLLTYANELEISRELAEQTQYEAEQKKEELVAIIDELAADKKAQETILAITQNNEATYQNLYADMQSAEQQIGTDIENLQAELDRLASGGELPQTSGSIVWPYNGHGTVTATFMDPDYYRLFGMYHYGVDVSLPTGTPLYSPCNGYITKIRFNPGSSQLGYMIIACSAQESVAMLHISGLAPGISEGMFVTRGQHVAYSGGAPGDPGAGFSTGPHLHFEVRVNGTRVDPISYIGWPP
jgi:murein DD-endopeptidase MepM/ murein hydrolase activator NlpD